MYLLRAGAVAASLTLKQLVRGVKGASVGGGVLGQLVEHIAKDHPVDWGWGHRVFEG